MHPAGWAPRRERDRRPMSPVEATVTFFQFLAAVQFKPHLAYVRSPVQRGCSSPHAVIRTVLPARTSCASRLRTPSMSDFCHMSALVQLEAQVAYLSSSSPPWKYVRCRRPSPPMVSDVMVPPKPEAGLIEDDPEPVGRLSASRVTDGVPQVDLASAGAAVGHLLPPIRVQRERGVDAAGSVRVDRGLDPVGGRGAARGRWAGGEPEAVGLHVPSR